MSSITSAEFGRLFVRYRERFVALANSYVHDRAVAEDIVADAFTKFWDARESIELKSCPPQVYILSMVRNKCLNHLRDTASRQRIINAVLREDIAVLESRDVASLMDDEVGQAISRYLESLPEDRREIFVASRFDGLSHAGIALKYGYTLRKIRRDIGKTLEGLREVLKAYL